MVGTATASWPAAPVLHARVRVRGQAPTVGPSMTAHMLGGERPPTGAVWWALLALYLFAALAEAVVAGDDTVCAAACAAHPS